MTILDNTIPSVCITATSSNILLQCHCTTAISEFGILIASGMHSPVTGNVLQIVCLWEAKSEAHSVSNQESWSLSALNAPSHTYTNRHILTV